MPHKKNKKIERKKKKRKQKKRERQKGKKKKEKAPFLFCRMAPLVSEGQCSGPGHTRVESLPASRSAWHEKQ